MDEETCFAHSTHTAMMRLHSFGLIGLLLLAACHKDQGPDPNRKPDETYDPIILPADFTNSTLLSHPYFLMETGKKYVFEGQSEDGVERIEVQRLGQTRTVLGIECIVVNDKVWLEGTLIEDTDDWYAQDNDGNVWYFGEEVDNYDDNGKFKDHSGAWEAGVDGAKPGIIMPADPRVGQAYREEYYFNEAEDEAEIIGTGLTVQTPYGTFTGCIKTRNWTELEPEVTEYKYYAPGLGVVREENPAESEEVNLIDIQ